MTKVSLNMGENVLDGFSCSFFSFPFLQSGSISVQDSIIKKQLKMRNFGWFSNNVRNTWTLTLYSKWWTRWISSSQLQSACHSSWLTYSSSSNSKVELLSSFLGKIHKSPERRFESIQFTVPSFDHNMLTWSKCLEKMVNSLSSSVQPSVPKKWVCVIWSEFWRQNTCHSNASSYLLFKVSNITATFGQIIFRHFKAAQNQLILVSIRKDDWNAWASIRWSFLM